MIGVYLAFNAEVLLAAGTSDTILRHMLSSRSTHCIALLVFCLVIDLCLLEFKDNIALWTFYDLGALHIFLQLHLADLLQLRTQKFSQIILIDHCSTLGTTTALEISICPLRQKPILGIS